MKNLNSVRGSAILWALLVSAGLSVLSIYVFNQSKINSQLATKMDADKDVDMAISQLGAALASPLNCSATMHGLPINPPGVIAPLPGVKICAPGATCSDGANAINFMAVQTGENWKLNLVDNLDTKARITLLQYRLLQYSVKLSPTSFKAGIVRIYVTFEKILRPIPVPVGSPKEYVTSFTPSNPANPAIHYFDVHVVTHSYNPIGDVFTMLTTFDGCAKSFNSINVY